MKRYQSYIKLYFLLNGTNSTRKELIVFLVHLRGFPGACGA